MVKLKKQIKTAAVVCLCIVALLHGRAVCQGAAKSEKAGSYTVSTKYCKNGSRRIYGRLYRPKRAGKTPVVIYAHGIGGTHASGVEYAEYFVKKGVAVYIFDFCGGGMESKSDGSTLDMSVMTEVSDLEAVLKTVRKWSFADKKKVTLLGASQGGIVSAAVAARNQKKVNGLMLLYPAFVIPDDVHKLYSEKSQVPQTFQVLGYITLGRKYALDVWDYDPYEEIAGYEKPVLILQGDADRIVPASYAERAAQAYPQATLKIYEGAGHGFYGEDSKNALSEMLRYMKKNKLL